MNGPFCGDGELQPGNDEDCDDGNQKIYDGCNTSCRVSTGVHQAAAGYGH